MNRKLRVLVADDENFSRRLITAALAKDFEICEAIDGQAAVEAFTAFQPDAVLLDVDMPRLDGIDTAREVKRLAGARFVPVFLVSGLEEQATLIRGLSAGADDFLPKPFNLRVFRPKLDVFLRLREMQQRLQVQNEQLEAYQHETQAEHQVALQVFTKMVTRGALADPRVRTHVSPLSVFNGDAVLANLTPQGQFRLIVADGTGHGLSAALGTLPLNTVFHGSTTDGEPLEKTAQRINLELKAVLPSHLFATAVLLEVDRDASTLSIINAGMPPVVVCGSEALGASRNIPLGISGTWAPQVDRHCVQTGDRVYVMSDGITEATSVEGVLFGAARALETLRESGAEWAFDGLIERVHRFSPDQADDISLVELLV